MTMTAAATATARIPIAIVTVTVIVTVIVAVTAMQQRRDARHDVVSGEWPDCPLSVVCCPFGDSSAGCTDRAEMQTVIEFNRQALFVSKSQAGVHCILKGLLS